LTTLILFLDFLANIFNKWKLFKSALRQKKSPLKTQKNMFLNFSFFVKQKHNLLSPNGDNVLNITLYPYSAIKPFVRGKMHTVSAIFSAFPVF